MEIELPELAQNISPIILWLRENYSAEKFMSLLECKEKGIIENDYPYHHDIKYSFCHYILTTEMVESTGQYGGEESQVVKDLEGIVKERVKKVFESEVRAANYLTSRFMSSQILVSDFKDLSFCFDAWTRCVMYRIRYYILAPGWGFK